VLSISVWINKKCRFVASGFGQVRDIDTIGMLEFWNIGIMGSGIMEWWV
jgi:hypothetical protein